MTTTTMTKATAKALKHPPMSDKEWEEREARHAKLMAKMNRLCDKFKADTQEDGIRFAGEVLKILDDAGGDDETSAIKTFKDEEGNVLYFRRGPQSRLLWRALNEYDAMHRSAQIGFVIVLTDFLGSVFNGAVPDVGRCYTAREAGQLETWQLDERGRPV
jgi:hypothetical protein